MRSALIAAGAVAVAVVLFVVLRPGDDEPSATPTTSTAATTETTPTVTIPVVPEPPQPPAIARVQIRIVDGLPQGGPRRLTVAQGRGVELVVTSDVADAIHLHGYDISREVTPGKPARIAFKATIAGTVEAELERRGVRIATITAKP